MYPRLVINRKKVEENARKVVEIGKKFGIEIVGVTKVSLGDPNVAECMKKAGIEVLGESRIQNIKRLLREGIEGPFMLLRIPMISELKEVVRLVDYVLVSENSVVNELDEVAELVGRTVNVIYMVDLGDLREGVWYEEAVNEISKVIHKKNANLIGIGTNFGCYGGVLPTVDNMKKLVEIKEAVEKKIKRRIEIVSGGSTVTLKLLENGTIPDAINQLRIGEAIVLGTDATGGRKIPWLSDATVILEAEVVEVKTKPSVPVGETGFDAFGRKKHFEDKGWRRRAILAIGEQDIDPIGLHPIDEKLEVLHASSDHTIVDITESDNDYKLGDIMKFKLSYGALLRAMTSPHVEKIYV
ncbi:MAG: alanine/ornithine racemase family PLP-dependent enzyme [Thermotogaceae bacterium]|nr:alanine/ornithine racemase family PLP-dependent enzyme [Thermotogaceae bacterium]